MLQIEVFCFNPFRENTYILFDDNKEAIIIDPGMINALEQIELDNFITHNQLKVNYILNTHCHIDHILGNKHCMDKYKAPLYYHKFEQSIMDIGIATANMYGLRYELSYNATAYLNEIEILKLGNIKLFQLFTPGHSPGSVSFYCKEANFVISGDALFKDSIGRTDLPQGDFNTLIKSIHTQLFTLSDNTIVYPGHGDPTQIGYEKLNNPFCKII